MVGGGGLADVDHPPGRLTQRVRLVRRQLEDALAVAQLGGPALGRRDAGREADAANAKQNLTVYASELASAEELGDAAHLGGRRVRAHALHAGVDQPLA